MYKKVSGSLNFKENEAQTLKFWQENKIFAQSIDSRRDGKTFIGYCVGVGEKSCAESCRGDDSFCDLFHYLLHSAVSMNTFWVVSVMR